jgi:Fur family transcriptional regulator, ferric uptake regulator
MNGEGQFAEGDFTSQASEFWRERGGRLTFARKIICDCVALAEGPFGAEDLWREARRKDAGISIASVYRTMVDLAEAGLLREIPRPGEQRSFMRRAIGEKPGGYLICRDCHRVIPLANECLELREGALVRDLGFQSANMHLQIEADCETLRRCGTCERIDHPGGKSDASQVDRGNGARLSG